MRPLYLVICFFLSFTASAQNKFQKNCVAETSFEEDEWIFWSPTPGGLQYFRDSLSKKYNKKFVHDEGKSKFKMGVTPGNRVSEDGNQKKKSKEKDLSLKENGNIIVIKKKCSQCAEEMEIWSGALQDIIDPMGPGYSRGAGTAHAKGGEVYYARNFTVSIPEGKPKLIDTSKAVKSANSSNDQSRMVEVAVFDTGLDTGLYSSYYRAGGSCNTLGQKGWNFIADNNDVSDDHLSRHGSVVSQLIIDQVQQYNGSVSDSRKIFLQIRPVKVLDSNGTGNLFDLLCGFAYARKSGIKIINASLGFYLYCDTVPEILTMQMAKLKQDNVLLIAAAGNVDEKEHMIAKRFNVAGTNLRNLEYHRLYPAALSGDYNNVIAVTTVGGRGKDLAVSPSQNFSAKLVNIGVPGDHYSFRFDLAVANGGRRELDGSSFATPIFAGKLISAGFLFPSRIGGAVFFNGENRNEIFNKMWDRGWVQNIGRLDKQVQMGRVLKR